MAVIESKTEWTNLFCLTFLKNKKEGKPILVFLKLHLNIS